jgi:predicted metal-dependent phosphoesterase TrpH
VIDLHLHTNVSDGRATPLELVELAAAHGLTVMAVTDHDTTGAVADVRRFASARGIEAVSGIEITAVIDGRDVHMLGYFIDPDLSGFQAFLASQRTSRLTRVEAFGDRLASLGMPVDLEAVLARGRLQSKVSIGRPQVARAMVAARHVASVREAFDKWLGTGRPAFVPRVGPPPEEVVGIVHDAGGLISLAHPGRTRIDERIPALRAAGLDALEVYHSDHDAADVDRYGALASALGLLATGGSDFHADPASSVHPGSVTLPRPAWERLLEARPHVA